MARSIVINGETLVLVKSSPNTTISSATELGLADSPIVISINMKYDDVIVDAWGEQVPADVQTFLTDVNITMRLVHFDQAVLRECIGLSMGVQAGNEGQLPHAGQLLGNGNARFVNGNNYVSLNLTSPILGLPWRFYNTYLVGNTPRWPLGTKRSLIDLTWRAIPYIADPYQSGSGASGQTLWDHVLDN